jgi:hypothetical protein
LLLEVAEVGYVPAGTGGKEQEEDRKKEEV